MEVTKSDSNQLSLLYIFYVCMHVHMVVVNEKSMNAINLLYKW